jgi:transcription initiation factor TFIIIB Brf1 subunit/transcription initiation factor TFIIB
MNLNQHIDTAEKLPKTQQQASMEQDNANKTAFALNLIQRLPQQASEPEEVRVPSLGAMAIPN